MGKRSAVFDPEIEAAATKKRSGGKKAKPADNTKEVNAMVAKKLRDNFKGWGSVATDGVVVQGLTLRQTLARDTAIHLDNPTKLRMGATYYAQLKTSFKGVDPALRKFSVKHPEETVHPALLAAIKETQQYHRNFQPLLTQLALMTHCNQKELVGLLKFNESLNPSVSQIQWSASIAIAALCCRLTLHESYPDEMDIAKLQWDKAFVAAFESLQRDGIELSTFVERYKGPLRLVANVEDIQSLLNRHGPWSSVHDVLNRVVASSAIGKRMFSFAMVHIIAHDVSQTIADGVSAYFKQVPKPTATSIAELKRRLVETVNNKTGIDVLPARRAVLMSYRSVEIKVAVDSVYDEVDKKVAAMLKSCGVSSGALKPLLCELELVVAAPESHTIDQELMESFQLARSQANTLLGSYAWTCGEELVEKLVEKQQLLVQLDATFMLEIEFMRSMAGETGDKELQSRILECLPSQNSMFDVAASSAKLGALQSSERFRYSSSAGKGSFNIVREIVGHIKCKLPPPMTAAQGNEFYQKVKSALGFFVVYDSKGDSGATTKHYGKEALSKQIMDIAGALEIKKEGGEEVLQLESMSNFSIFNFFLNEDDKLLVAGWLKTAVSSLKIAPVVPTMLAEKSKSAQKAESAKRAKKKTAADAAMSFFE